MTSISAFLPCFNDETSIEVLIDATLATIDLVGADGSITVIDDGSSDGSAALLEKVSAREARLQVITHPHNKGYGAALLSGFTSATRQWVFYTDGDGQFDTAELALLVSRAASDVDVVQGYKLSRADGPVRAVVGRAYHHFVARVFGLQVRDTDCDFRLIRRSVLERIDLTCTSGAICVELVRKLQDVGARFVEVGVHHYARESGSSQFFRLPNVMRTWRDLATLWWSLRRRRAGSRITWQ